MFRPGWLSMLESSFIVGILSAVCLSLAIRVFNGSLQVIARLAMQFKTISFGDVGLRQPRESVGAQLVGRFAATDLVVPPTQVQLLLVSCLTTLCWTVLTSDNHMWRPSILAATFDLVSARLPAFNPRLAQIVSTHALLFFLWFAAIRWQTRIRIAPAFGLTLLHCTFLLAASTLGCVAVALLHGTS